jgi:hypothetical protein
MIDLRALRDRLPEDMTMDLLRLIASVVSLVIAIILGSARVG